MEERLDRRAIQQSGTAAPPRQGLVPALKPARLKKRVDKLMTEFRSGPIGETRFLANFTLHSALIRNPNSGARLDQNGKVTLPIPDKQVGRISKRYQGDSGSRQAEARIINALNSRAGSYILYRRST